jgi:hypothetical protein
MHYPPLSADLSGFLNPQSPGVVGTAAIQIAGTGIDAASSRLEITTVTR